LIIGGVLFVAGIIIAAVWAVPFVSMFLQENTLIKEVSIEPGESVEATTLVTDVSRPITVAIHIERSGGAVVTDEGQQQQQQVPQEQAVMRLIETVNDPSGTVVSSNEFSSNLFTTFQPRNGGNHVLNITNAGSRSVAIDATFGYMPFITSAAPPPPSEGGQRLPGVGLDLSSLSAVIAGGVLSVIGFFTIIAGIIIVVIDSRKRRGEEQKSSGVTEGSITYRKD
jgi:hypothetical protein